MVVFVHAHESLQLLPSHIPHISVPLFQRCIARVCVRVQVCVCVCVCVCVSVCLSVCLSVFVKRTCTLLLISTNCTHSIPQIHALLAEYAPPPHPYSPPLFPAHSCAPRRLPAALWPLSRQHHPCHASRRTHFLLENTFSVRADVDASEYLPLFLSFSLLLGTY